MPNRVSGQRAVGRGSNPLGRSNRLLYEPNRSTAHIPVPRRRMLDCAKFYLCSTSRAHFTPTHPAPTPSPPRRPHPRPRVYFPPHLHPCCATLVPPHMHSDTLDVAFSVICDIRISGNAGNRPQGPRCPRHLPPSPHRPLVAPTPRLPTLTAPPVTLSSSASSAAIWLTW